MAYVNVAEWTPDQVSEWLRGLDDVIHPYIHTFVSNEIDGRRLLHISADCLPHLKVTCIGHQEIILQGVELLRNIHFHLHQENVQYLALRLSSTSRSIYNELFDSNSYTSSLNDTLEEHDENGDDGLVLSSSNMSAIEKNKKERVSTKIIAGVADVLSSVKMIVSWLHRSPFQGMELYDDLKSKLVDISIGLATIAQRDSFAENPVSVIRDSCIRLAEMADQIIQDSKDPLILQPASLDVVTIRKRADDNWGLGFFSSYIGVHQISLISALSPAHACGKIMGGDQVVQVNYQTVVGWASLRVTQLMQENPTEVILTVKKCPRHVNTITEIYFKPIRLPSKKRTYSPWINMGISPSKYDLHSIPNLQFIETSNGRNSKPSVIPESFVSTTPPSAGEGRINSSGSDLGVTASESDDLGSELDDDAFLSDDNDDIVQSSLSVRLFQPKPRPIVQRRATIPGATARPSLGYDHILQDFCHYPHLTKEFAAIMRRDEDDSDCLIRPHTCIGNEKCPSISSACSSGSGGGNFGEESVLPHLALGSSKEMPFIDEIDEKEEEEHDEEKKSGCSENASINEESDGIVEIKITDANEALPKTPQATRHFLWSKTPTVKVDIEPCELFVAENENSKMDLNMGGLHPELHRRKERRLDKSHSSPAYEDEEEEQGGAREQTTNESQQLSVNQRRNKFEESLGSKLNVTSSLRPAPLETGSSKMEDFFQNENLIKELKSKHLNSSLSPINKDDDEVFVIPAAVEINGEESDLNAINCSISTPICSHEEDLGLSPERVFTTYVNPSTQDSSMTYSNIGATDVLALSAATVTMVTSTLDIGYDDIIGGNGSDNYGFSPHIANVDTLSNDKKVEVSSNFGSSKKEDEEKNSEIGTNNNNEMPIGNFNTEYNSDGRNPMEYNKKMVLETTETEGKPEYSAKLCLDEIPKSDEPIVSINQNIPLKSRTRSGILLSSEAPSILDNVVYRDSQISSSIWRRGGNEDSLDDSSGKRRISCKDLGQGDHHGWLYRRKETKGFLMSHRWEKRWFILKKSYLYGYRDKESNKADSLIYLPGFHVCPAADVKSKRYAFKIYHSSGATFYFACETGEERSRWMSRMGLSAISSRQPQPQLQPQHHQQILEPKAEAYDEDAEAYYSETDDELDDKRVIAGVSPNLQRKDSPLHMMESSSDGSPGGVGKLSSGSSSSSSNNKSNPLSSLGNVLSSSSKAIQCSPKVQGLKFLQSARVLNQPVPTPNFRSYIRVREQRKSTSTSNLMAGNVKVEKDPSGTPNNEKVHRKNSLRERFLHLPTLTLDRRKKTDAKTGQNSSVLKSSSKSETCLIESLNVKHVLGNKDKENSTHRRDSIGSIKESGELVLNIPTVDKLSPSKIIRRGPFRSNSSIPNYMKSTHSSHQSTSNSDKMKDTLDAEVNNRNDRRGSIGGLSSRSSESSVSSRRSSLDYVAGSAAMVFSRPNSSDDMKLKEKSHQKNIPKSPPIYSKLSDTKVDDNQATFSFESPHERRLKKTNQYHPIVMRNHPGSRNPLTAMSPTFEISLQESVPDHFSTSAYGRTPIRKSSLNLNSSAPGRIGNILSMAKYRPDQSLPIGKDCLNRPQVPPRTKFLSVSERVLSDSSSSSSSSSPMNTQKIEKISTESCKNITSQDCDVSNTSPRSILKNNGVNCLRNSSPAGRNFNHDFAISSTTNSASSPLLSSRISASKLPPNLTLSPIQDDSDGGPKTPLKPTMGVAMIGKQRRTTPGAMSPKEILPNYPGMEYPPTFEPESYSLSLSTEAIHSYLSNSPLPVHHRYVTSSHPGGTSSYSSDSSPSHSMISDTSGPLHSHSSLSNIDSAHNASYYRSGLPSATIVSEQNAQSLHHSIYVTSPYNAHGASNQSYNLHRHTRHPNDECGEYVEFVGTPKHRGGQKLLADYSPQHRSCMPAINYDTRQTSRSNVVHPHTSGSCRVPQAGNSGPFNFTTNAYLPMDNVKSFSPVIKPNNNFNNSNN